MARIRFTPIAKYKYDKILDYAYEEFGETTERRFEDAFLKIADRLSVHPLSSPKESILSYLSKSRTRTYYRVHLNKYNS